jgi:hypothetical protein
VTGVTEPLLCEDELLELRPQMTIRTCLAVDGGRKSGGRTKQQLVHLLVVELLLRLTPDAAQSPPEVIRQFFRLSRAQATRGHTKVPLESPSAKIIRTLYRAKHKGRRSTQNYRKDPASKHGDQSRRSNVYHKTYLLQVLPEIKCLLCK